MDDQGRRRRVRPLIGRRAPIAGHPRIVGVIVLGLASLGVHVLSATAQTVAVTPTVTTAGARFVDAAGSTVVLRGVNAHPSASSATVLATGSNFARIYIKWSDIEPTAPAGDVHAWSASALAQIDTLVGGLRDAGVQVLIDVHQCGWSTYWGSITSGCSNGIPAWYYADGRFPVTGVGRSDARAAWWTTEAERSSAAYVPFLQMIVARYAAYENVVGYELVNEPPSGSLGSSTDATNRILAWQAAMIPVVRALDPWRAIVVMGRGGGEGIGTADLSLLGEDPHLVLDWHDYYNGRAGTGLDAAGDEWVPSWSASHMQDTTTYDGTVEAQWEVLRIPIARTGVAGMPLLVGEWGVRKDAANASAYQEHMLGLFEDQGLSWARWVLSASDAMGIRTSGGDLTAAGIQLRDRLTGPAGTSPNDGPPVALAPTIAGEPLVGATMTALPGVWERRPYAFTYRWDRCIDGACAAIDGASTPGYVLGPEDLGATIRVTVAGLNLWGFSGPAASALTTPVTDDGPQNAAPPQIVGTPSIGATLSATPGTWSPAATSYAYRWQRCTTACVDVEGATGSTFAVGDADIGAALRVVVVAFAGAAVSAPAVSAQTTVVPLPVPVNLTLPTVSGTAKRGTTLTGGAGTWKYVASFTYQWQRCGSSCTAISGATSASYTLGSSDVGKTIRLKVTGRNATGSVIAISAKTASVVR